MPRLEPDTRLVRVVHGNVVIAESRLEIRGYLGFYPTKLACYVGEHRVSAQPGGLYGGWVTPDVVGPFKGEPGTGAW